MVGSPVAGDVAGRRLPVEAENGVLEELSGWRPVLGLQLQAPQGDVPQSRGEVGRDGRCGRGARDLRIRQSVSKDSRQASMCAYSLHSTNAQYKDSSQNLVT